MRSCDPSLLFAAPFVCVLCARQHACEKEAVANRARVQATIATRYGVFELFCSGQHGLHGYSQQ